MYCRPAASHTTVCSAKCADICTEVTASLQAKALPHFCPNYTVLSVETDERAVARPHQRVCVWEGSGRSGGVIRRSPSSWRSPRISCWPLSCNDTLWRLTINDCFFSFFRLAMIRHVSTVIQPLSARDAFEGSRWQSRGSSGKHVNIQTRLLACHSETHNQTDTETQRKKQRH